MKLQLCLPVSIMVSVALVGVMKIRKKEHDRVDRHSRFEAIKLRVTHDVLGEYQSEKAVTQDLLDTAEKNVKALAEEVNTLQMKDTKKKGNVDTCQAGQKTARDELASAETDLNNLQAESSKEKAGWSTELATLKQQLETRSPVCDFLKPGQDSDKKLCVEVIAEAPKPEEPKAEAPKPEEPKAEAPKPEEPKAEAPKPEEPKAEAPKPEEPQAEAPKPEEPKAEAPKPEEPKAEAPKPEEPKAEAPKPEESKAEAPKPEEAKAEAPKPEEPKAEAPKPEEPKAEAPKKR
ncbi:pollen-specific leucine-rich repeat extensin-like protein 1 isoform X1 [Thunnus albacares]|uniref:pollen-specific leucine-rich repeat extensin-like protein 1 isoform X1 n=1 Tax=Thunnus albacares TaxID=8236 RepID=UPI001CF67B1E|nr:pollen-specific leucine-rich repeat extensin-like protein 1 isoform X1 [Thunnus albacares]XP_044215888.1 pollen-specific leucine-rich repeat extensin-like protein 1 isoform X1 [Thunnus albacares]